MRRISALVVCAAVAGLAAAPAVPAQTKPEPGVTVDPGSPSGKEYALPFDRARKDAAPAASGRRGNSSSGGDATTALFGAGVSRDRAATAARADGRGGTQGGGGNGGAGREGDTAPGSSTSGSTPARSAAVTRASASTLGAGLGQTAAIVGIALGVLLLGGGAGFALRRRQEP